MQRKYVIIEMYLKICFCIGIVLIIFLVVSEAETFYLLGNLFEETGILSVPVTKKYRAGKDDMLQSFLCHV